MEFMHRDQAGKIHASGEDAKVAANKMKQWLYAHFNKLPSHRTKTDEIPKGPEGIYLLQEDGYKLVFTPHETINVSS